MKKSSPKRSVGKTPRPRRQNKVEANGMNQATTAEFEREDMGIAPKE